MSAQTIFELRRYRLRPGKRDDLVSLFDREFVETQEAEGMALPGQFTDADDPDAFVWFRSFPDMESRARSLSAFYGGPVWAEYGSAANRTMLNSNNVLLLRPANGVAPFGVLAERPVPGASVPGGVVQCVTCSLAPGRDEDFLACFEERARPVLAANGAEPDALFVTEHAENTFPRLPVRAGETAVVWVTRFESEDAFLAAERRIAADPDWTEHAFPELDRRLWRPMERVRLKPTPRSRFR